MRRRLSSIRIPPLVRLLLLFAILTIPLLAGRFVAQVRGEALSNGPPPPDCSAVKRL